MSAFTDKKIEFMNAQRLGRPTVDEHGNPHLVPVGFRYNPSTGTIDIGGHGIARTHKWSHAAAHPRVAFVVDDVLPPWRPRSIEIRADVELLKTGDQDFPTGFDPEIMRLHPVKITAWGLDTKRSRSRRICSASRQVESP